MKQIVIQIAPDGKVTIEGVGFTGKACDEKMAAFEKEMGKVEKRTDKPEYHTTVTTQQKVSGK